MIDDELRALAGFVKDKDKIRKEMPSIYDILTYLKIFKETINVKQVDLRIKQ